MQWLVAAPRPGKGKDTGLDLKIAPLTVQHQVAQKLREAIFAGHFKPGQKVVEARLCADMGVSRPSLREALRRLESERLITVIPNRGPFVVRIEWDEALELYHTRALLEGEAAALCAARRRPEDILAMRSALAGFAGAARAEAPLERLALDRIEFTRQFYAALLAASGNRVIRELLEGLLARISFLRACSMSRAGRAKQSAAEMRRILAAVERGDAAAARTAAVAHVSAACAAAKEVFEVNQQKVA